MGKTTGFLECSRVMNPAIPPEERIENYREFHFALDKEQRQEQGARCMNCGVPFCQSGVSFGGVFSGCPLHNLIPEWNDEIYRGNWEQALTRLRRTNPFPEFTGRVCPAPCEAACTCGLYGAPVTIRENELAIIESGFAENLVQPQPPAVRSGKRVAVIGSGPAGLAAADALNQRGHSVTVFERDARPGGLLMYGVPNMKLEKKIVERRIQLMEVEGIEFRTGVDVGRSLPAEVVLAEYDAIILCCGAGQPRDLEVPGRMAIGVYFALDFLMESTRILLGEQKEAVLSATGKHVVIIGGGDTGNDCVGTCIRQGCRSVRQLVRKPRLPELRSADNPWPQVPRIYKMDYGQEEASALFGGDPRMFQTKAKELITDENGALTGIRIIRSEPVWDMDGKLRMEEQPETIQEIPCDLLLLATGFSGCEPYAAEAFGVTLTPRGNLETAQGGYATDKARVFAAGDARRGASLVVWAIAEGRACAKEVDTFLMGYTNMV